MRNESQDEYIITKAFKLKPNDLKKSNSVYKFLV